MHPYKVSTQIVLVLILSALSAQSRAGTVHLEWSATIREYGNWSIPGYYSPGFPTFLTSISTTFSNSVVDVRPNFSNSTLTTFGGAQSTAISSSILNILPGPSSGIEWRPQTQDTFIHVSDQADGTYYAEFGSRINDNAVLNDGSTLSQTFFVVQRGYISGSLAEAFRQVPSAADALDTLLQDNNFFVSAQVTSSWVQYINSSAAAGEGYYGSARLVSATTLPVPEPSSAMLLLAGLAALSVAGRRALN